MELRDALAAREEIAMQENGSRNVQSTMPEEPQGPRWADHAKGEGPIETAGPGPTQKEPVPIPPSASRQRRSKGGSKPGRGKGPKGPKGRQGQGTGGRA